MWATIEEAIETKHQLTFRYKGAVRVVEPHALGINQKGHKTLCAWQISGGSGQGFRDFHISEMSGVAILDIDFLGPRPGYLRGDTTLPVIHAQL